ncbi:MAG: aminoacyl-tRNA hydrolase [Hyphomicrobium sp.]
MKLFVGLGNPGSEYARNRHNVGFLCVDRIASAHGCAPWKKKFQALACEGEIAGERITLLKPQTYMNESGRAVGEAAHFLKIPESDIVVFYDEIDLAPGKLKVKTGGGNAGHNGLRSISAHLGNDYVRVRIGVGHPGQKELVARWVLNDFAKADAAWLDPLLDAIAKSAPRLAKSDQARFLTDVARELGSTVSDPEGLTLARKSSAESTERAAGTNSEQRSSKHPAGERQSKSQSAIAENLKKWLAGRQKSKD